MDDIRVLDITVASTHTPEPATLAIRANSTTVCITSISPIAPHPMPYAELHCQSCYSFLRGASHPHELVERAAALGYRALAIDRRVFQPGQ